MRFDFGRWREFGVGLALGLSLSLFVLIWQNYREKHAATRRRRRAASPSRAPTRPRPPATPRKARRTTTSTTCCPSSKWWCRRRTAKSRASRGNAPANIERPGVYVLQAGSYRQQAEADRIRAQLKMQGIDANVQRVAVDEDVWHRVRIGPHHRSGRAQSPARAPARRGFRRCAGHPGGRLVRCAAVARCADSGRRGIADAAGRLRHAAATPRRHRRRRRRRTRARGAAPPAAHASRASRSPPWAT